MTSYAADCATDSPLVGWEFGDASGTTAADVTGNSRTGTYNNGVALNQPGFGNADVNAALFDGVDDSVTSSYNPFSAGGVRAFEICFKRTSSGAAHTLIHDSNSLFALFLASGANSVSFYNNTGTEGVHTWASVFGGNGVEVHLGLNVNDSGATSNGLAAHTAELFINGVSQGTKAIANAGANGTLRVGGNAGVSSFIPAKLGRLRVYPSILSAARWLSHYNNLIQSLDCWSGFFAT